MKNYRKLAKSDGYIKNQCMRIKQNRGYILFKISIVVFPLALFLAVATFGTLSTPSPEKWKHEEITLKNVSWEVVFLLDRHRSRAYVLNTEQGEQFVLLVSINEGEALSKQLVPGRKYHIVYTGNYFNNFTKALSDDNREFIKLEESVAKWEKERKEYYIFAVISVFIMSVGSVLIFTFLCKEERREIAKIKSKMDERLRKKMVNQK